MDRKCSFNKSIFQLESIKIKTDIAFYGARRSKLVRTMPKNAQMSGLSPQSIHVSLTLYTK
jgi:hypothetical protein